MNDEWNACYEPKYGMSTSDFQNMFCKSCNNASCVRSEGVTALKIKHNLSMLSPIFAPLSDPRRGDIPDFQDRFQEAMRIEVSTKKNDWSVPTPEELVNAAQEVIQQVQSFQVPSDTERDKTYQVMRYPDGTWGCNCPAFTFGRTVPCKHITDMQQGQLIQPKHFQKEATVEAPPPNLGKAIYPTLKNTPAQVMPDNTVPRPAERRVVEAPKAPPAADPWAAPVKKDVIIPVGGRIVLKGGG